MIDQRQMGSEDTAGSSPGSPPGIGASIVASLKHSMDRIKTDPDPGTTDLAATQFAKEAPPMPTPPATSSHLGSGLRPTAAPRPKPAQDRLAPAAQTKRQSRRARLRISRVDPWSVMKTSLLFGVAGWIILIVATWILFTVIEQTGLYDQINQAVSQVFAAQDGSSAWDVQSIVNTTKATAIAALVGAVNVVILTALATIFAFLYNLGAVVMGGIEITMAED